MAQRAESGLPRPRKGLAMPGRAKLEHRSARAQLGHQSARAQLGHRPGRLEVEQRTQRMKKCEAS